MYFLSEVMLPMYIFFSYLQFQFNLNQIELMKWNTSYDEGEYRLKLPIPPQARLVRVEIFLYSETRPENLLSWIAMRVRTTDEELALLFF